MALPYGKASHSAASVYTAHSQTNYAAQVAAEAISSQQHHIGFNALSAAFQ